LSQRGRFGFCGADRGEEDWVRRKEQQQWRLGRTDGTASWLEEATTVDGNAGCSTASMMGYCKKAARVSSSFFLGLLLSFFFIFFIFSFLVAET
jgi:hypothetical protein